jgi:hypothetical protein
MNPLPSQDIIENIGKDKYRAETKWQLRLCRVANKNTYLINHVSDIDIVEMHEIYKEWLEALVYEDSVYSEFEKVELIDGRNVTTSKQMHIMIELFRMKSLINWTKWITEHEVLKQMYSVPENPQKYDLRWSISMTESPVWAEDAWASAGLWKKPVSMFVQNEIIICIQYLCERMLDTPTDQTTVSDLKRLMNILMTRNGQVFCTHSSKDMMNVKDMRELTTNSEGKVWTMFNRKYAMFCATYFTPIFKKIQLYDLFWPKRMIKEELNMPNMEEKIEQVRTWFRKDVCDSLGQDAFDDCYNGVLEDAYSVPGDKKWFKFNFPERPMAVGSILHEFRPELAKVYFSEERATKKTLWASAERYRHGFVARAFVFKAIDDYMINRYTLEWRDYVVIEEQEFGSQMAKIYGENTPFLVQVMSRYWVFDNASQPQDICYTWPTDCIYESIAVWFHILLTRYRGICMGVDLSHLINQIFQPKQVQLKDNCIVDEI